MHGVEQFNMVIGWKTYPEKTILYHFHAEKALFKGPKSAIALECTQYPHTHNILCNIADLSFNLVRWGLTRWWPSGRDHTCTKWPRISKHNDQCELHLDSFATRIQGDYLNFHHLGEVRDLDDDRERCDAQWNNHRRRLWTESRQTQGKIHCDIIERRMKKPIPRLVIVWLLWGKNPVCSTSLSTARTRCDRAYQLPRTYIFLGTRKEKKTYILET